MTDVFQAPERALNALHYVDPADVREGARSLLLNCAGMMAGQTVVILAEDPAFGWYDSDAPRITAELAREMGGKVSLIPVGGPDEPLLLPFRPSVLLRI